ncbi:hypothetical protein KFU94_12345 [Chloroflexi bacterium TSY]|nr:hypothetical protein [Chloroflexi bacterium TSY]
MALTLGALTTPGPTQRLALDFAYLDYSMQGAFPLILIPAYRVPQGIFFHLLSMRALAREQSTSRQGRMVLAT